jgi:hypothetical protein
VLGYDNLGSAAKNKQEGKQDVTVQLCRKRYYNIRRLLPDMIAYRKNMTRKIKRLGEDSSFRLYVQINDFYGPVYRVVPFGQSFNKQGNAAFIIHKDIYHISGYRCGAAYFITRESKKYLHLFKSRYKYSFGLFRTKRMFLVIYGYSSAAGSFLKLEA